MEHLVMLLLSHIYNFMKRIAHIENNYIVNVSVAEDDYVLANDGTQMLESDALAQGYVWKPQESDYTGTFLVQPENFRLATNREDEAEFGKLIVLINLSLQQNKITPATPIIVWDYVKQPHSVIVSRFLEIMADYGMYCYMQRS